MGGAGGGDGGGDGGGWEMEDCSELREREAAHSFEEEQAIAAFLGLAYHPQVMAPSYMLIPHHCLSHTTAYPTLSWGRMRAG